MARIVSATVEGIAEAAALLRAGEVCAFPTETVYGLGANALSDLAIQKIYQLKGRPAFNPLIVHVENMAQVRDLVTSIPSQVALLARRFWPGPLTLVLPRAAHVPARVSAGLDTIAVRVPAHPVAQALLHAAQLPICAPSANRSEQVSPTRAEHVAKSLPDVPLILDGGPCDFGIESTVVDLTREHPVLLRPGAVAVSKLIPMLPNLVLPASPGAFLSEGDAHHAPGQMKRHYAPRAPLLLFSDATALPLDRMPSPVGWLVIDPPPAGLMRPSDLIEPLPDDPTLYAADLYAALHRLDDRQVQAIVVQRPPHTLAWLAVLDRLERAAHGSEKAFDSQ